MTNTWFLAIGDAAEGDPAQLLADFHLVGPYTTEYAAEKAAEQLWVLLDDTPDVDVTDYLIAVIKPRPPCSVEELAKLAKLITADTMSVTTGLGTITVPFPD